MNDAKKSCSVATDKQAHHFLRALGDETRRDMIQLLLTREINVSLLAKEIILDASTVSYHLSILKKAGLIDKARREGKERYYCANRDLLQKGLKSFTREYRSMYGLGAGRN